MKRVFLSVLAVVSLAAMPALAAFSDMDTDGDGVLTPEEFAAGYPSQPPEAFTATDLNADGVVSEEELLASVSEGVLPAE